MAELVTPTPAGTNGVEGAVTADMKVAAPEVAVEAVAAVEPPPAKAAEDDIEVDIPGEEVSLEDGATDEPKEGELPKYEPEAFEKAEAGAQFTDANGVKFEKVEGVAYPVPMCNQEAPLYKELAGYGFDQDIINREFWAGKGEVSEDTLASLKAVFPPGMVDDYFASKKAEHLAYLDGISRSNSAAEVAKRESIERVQKRDSETIATVAEVFGVDDGAAKWTEMVNFINSNYEVDRRKEIAATIQSGTIFARKALLNAIKRDADFAHGDVHRLINADGAVSVARVGGGALTSAQYHDIISNPKNPDHQKWHSDPTFQAEIDARRAKGIQAGM